MGTIYALEATDAPNEPRYVGFTTRRYLSNRLTGHRFDARRNGRTSPVCDWIRDVLARGADIRGVVLKEFVEAEAEVWWIEQLRSHGADLLNSRGGGNKGGSFDAESRAKLSEANKRAFAKPERLGMRQGENGTNVRLTEDAVRAIRARYANGGVTHRKLATEYGVDRTTIGKIINRDLWAHV